MRQPLRSLRRRRERGRRRVALATVGSAAGATALAVTFGAVLAAGQAPRANATSTAPVNAVVAPVDRVSVDKGPRATLRPEQIKREERTRRGPGKSIAQAPASAS